MSVSSDVGAVRVNEHTHTRFFAACHSMPLPPPLPATLPLHCLIVTQHNNGFPCPLSVLLVEVGLAVIKHSAMMVVAFSSLVRILGEG